MKHFLIKSEPSTYSWDDFVKSGRDHWDGVRNFQALQYIKEMKVGDWCLFYHSVKEKSVIGIAEVVKEYYPDHTTEEKRWYMMDIVPIRKLKRPVTLAEIKADPRLEKMRLVTNSRLSVQPVRKEEFDIVIAMSEG